MKKVLSLCLVLSFAFLICACKTNEISCEEKFNNMLNTIQENVQVGTAGSSLKAVPYAFSLLDWAKDTSLSSEEIKALWDAKKETLTSNELNELKDQLSLVFNIYTALTTESGKGLVEDSGYETNEVLPIEKVSKIDDLISIYSK